MRRLTSAASTHCGCVREHNEDAYLKGERVFAVADGMGGAQGGEVASATALLPIAALDGQEFGDAAAVRNALLEAFIAANTAVSRKASEEPALRGMGTTLTTAIVDGCDLHVAHVGDSRAYLVRNGQLEQLTRDHTVVAELIAKGELTTDEAAVHPLRSSISRAIGVLVDTNVDLVTVKLVDRDRLLLCSDGLTRPVSEDDILGILCSECDVHEAARRLVRLANDRGGPDNVTVLLLRYDDSTTQTSEGDTPTDFPRTVEQPSDSVADDSAQHNDHRIRRSRLRPVAVVLAGMVGFVAGYWWLSSSFYVGIHHKAVVIYRGLPAALGPLRLSWMAERSEVHATELASFFVVRLRDGVPAADLEDARRIITTAPRRPRLKQGTRSPLRSEPAATDRPAVTGSTSYGPSPGRAGASP